MAEGPTWTVPQQNLVLGGLANTLVDGAVTITFPSNKFCKNHVDETFLNHVHEIALNGNANFGNGLVNAAGLANCGHRHITGGTGIAFKWSSATAVDIVAYGDKGGAGAKVKGSGGYSWSDK